MPISQNGYPANDIALTSVRTIPGTERKIRLRNGPAGDLLLWVLSQFDRLVEDLDGGELDDWGYAERPIRGSTTVLSNHASGTAADANATRHPLGTDPADNFTPAQIATIHNILARTEGCVRWGGDYVGRKDPMHFEINDGVSENRCAAVLTKLNSQTDGIDMTKQELEEAVYSALYRIFFGTRFADKRNFGDEEAQQTGSLLGMQGQNDRLIAQNDQIIAQNKDLIEAVKGLKPLPGGQAAGQ